MCPSQRGASFEKFQRDKASLKGEYEYCRPREQAGAVVTHERDSRAHRENKGRLSKMQPWGGNDNVAIHYYS